MAGDEGVENQHRGVPADRSNASDFQVRESVRAAHH
jgi:hypothetical protein